MELKTLAEARDTCAVRISWPALFLKAYGLVAHEVPELRQTWYRFPWAHLYQHPDSVGMLTIQREVAGEPWLFWGRISSPETMTLTDLQTQIDRFRDGDVEAVFKRQMSFAHLPKLIRRTIWRWNLNIATRNRAKRLGTFFLSTLAGRGVEIQLPPSIHTGCLTFGPLDSDHSTRVTLAYDHRIMDGALVADVLQRLEQALKETLLLELRSLQTLLFP